MGRPVVGAVVGAAALVVTLGGCGAFAQACPAIGWTNTVEVHVPGSDAADSPVREVAFCGGRDCTPPSAPPRTPSSVPSSPPGALTPGPEPPALRHTFGRTTEHDGATWPVMTDMGTPEHGRVALRDAAGTTTTERAVDLTWVRHGGSEQCGGPSTARVTVTP
jgi:hypothetical protein